LKGDDLTSQQLAILNSLVTFAAENIPGGLSEDEREVAKIVGWALGADKLAGLYTVRTRFYHHGDLNENLLFDEAIAMVKYRFETSNGAVHFASIMRQEKTVVKGGTDRVP
jgi:hypothetical protein